MISIIYNGINLTETYGLQLQDPYSPPSMGNVSLRSFSTPDGRTVNTGATVGNKSLAMQCVIEQSDYTALMNAVNDVIRIIDPTAGQGTLQITGEIGRQYTVIADSAPIHQRIAYNASRLTLSFQCIGNAKSTTANVVDGIGDVFVPESDEDVVGGSANAYPIITCTISGDTGNEKQQIVFNGTPTGGTFTITHLGNETDDIAYDATGSAVQSALTAAGITGVTVTEITNGYELEFGGDNEGVDVALVEVSNKLQNASTSRGLLTGYHIQIPENINSPGYNVPPNTNQSWLPAWWARDYDTYGYSVLATIGSSPVTWTIERVRMQDQAFYTENGQENAQFNSDGTQYGVVGGTISEKPTYRTRRKAQFNLSSGSEITYSASFSRLRAEYENAGPFPVMLGTEKKLIGEIKDNKLYLFTQWSDETTADSELAAQNNPRFQSVQLTLDPGAVSSYGFEASHGVKNWQKAFKDNTAIYASIDWHFILGAGLVRKTDNTKDTNPHNVNFTTTHYLYQTIYGTPQITAASIKTAFINTLWSAGYYLEGSTLSGGTSAPTAAPVWFTNDLHLEVRDFQTMGMSFGASKNHPFFVSAKVTYSGTSTSFDNFLNSFTYEPSLFVQVDEYSQSSSANSTYTTTANANQQVEIVYKKGFKEFVLSLPKAYRKLSYSNVPEWTLTEPNTGTFSFKWVDGTNEYKTQELPYNATQRHIYQALNGLEIPGIYFDVQVMQSYNSLDSQKAKQLLADSGYDYLGQLRKGYSYSGKRIYLDVLIKIYACTWGENDRLLDLPFSVANAFDVEAEGVSFTLHSCSVGVQGQTPTISVAEKQKGGYLTSAIVIENATTNDKITWAGQVKSGGQVRINNENRAIEIKQDDTWIKGSSGLVITEPVKFIRLKPGVRNALSITGASDATIEYREEFYL